jgi:hypothetical protein
LQAGSKLLAADTKIAWRLMWKSISGEDKLTRRERRQFVRSVSF